ncbi:hypothetical protein AAHC03_025752 [Spirometra sp. Aus1]
MEKAWICEACFSVVSSQSSGRPSSPIVQSQFRSQHELIAHIKMHHLSRRIERGTTVFICTYGQSGVCSERRNPGYSTPPFSPTNRTAVFDSEYDYEQHLVSRHLLNLNQAHLTSQTRRSFTSTRNTRNWTMYDSVVNMAAVLNDPLDRQLDIFSRDWGEAFERAVVLPLNQPEITERHFRAYLVRLSQRQARLMPLSRHPSGEVSTPPSPSATDPATIIPSIFLASDFDLANPQTFHRVIPLHPRGSTSQRHQQTSSESRLPSDQSPAPISQSAAFSNQNERLSQYLDAVELRIIKHVSKQSSAFFEAVRGHDVVREKLSQTLADVRAAREKLGQLDGIYCETAAQMTRLERRRANYKRLLKQLQLVASVHSAQPTIQSLLKSNDFCAALDLVSSTQELLSAPDTPNFACLRHLSAQLTEIARFVQNMVVAEFQVAIQDCLDKKTFLNLSSEAKSVAVSPAFTLSEDASDLMPSVLGLLRIGHYEFVDILRKEVLDLVRTCLQTSVDALQSRSDTVDGTVNGITKATTISAVPTVPGSESVPPSTGLGSVMEDPQRIGKYSQASWLQLVHSVCRNLELALGMIRAVVLVIVHSIEQSVGSQPISSSDSGPAKSVPQEIGEDLIRKVLRVYWDAVSWCQTRIINLVSPRARTSVTNLAMSNGPTTPSESTDDSGKTEANERLTASEFVQVAELLDSFQQVVQDAWCFFTAPVTINSHSIDKSAPTASSSSTTTVVVNLPPQAMRLHGVIANFASGLLHSFHLDRCTKLRLMLDHETWQAAAVPAPVQSLVDVLHQRKVSALSSPSAVLVDTAESKSSPYLTLNRERYIVVGTVLLLLPLIMDYLRLADQLSQWPSLVRDIQNRLGKLLGVFNSRSCELVLGAGARDLSVLNTISARNLALVCRSLEVILAILPCLTAFFEKLVGAREKNAESGEARMLQLRRNFPLESRRRPPGGDPFGVVEQAVRTHLSQVMDKLTHLLAGRIASKLSAWRVQPPTPSPQLRAICQAMSKLTETTSDVLSPDMLTNLLLRVHLEFKAGLRQRLSDLSVFPDGGPQQGLVDSELAFYLNNLRGLTTSLGHFTDDCDDIWPSR